MTRTIENDNGLGRRGALLLAAALASVSLAVAVAPGVEKASPRTASSGLKIYSVERKGYVMTERVRKSDAEWRASLTSEQYRVLREAGTERAFTGALWNNREKGVYRCAACGIDLFTSETKFESGTGWPSFYAPVAKENVALREDDSMMMKRTEAVCARCESHLGHVFDDGPKPTRLRYCINSASLSFAKKS